MSPTRCNAWSDHCVSAFSLRRDLGVRSTEPVIVPLATRSAPSITLPRDVSYGLSLGVWNVRAMPA